jgi:hypothetical protein
MIETQSANLCVYPAAVWNQTLCNWKTRRFEHANQSVVLFTYSSGTDVMGHQFKFRCSVCVQFKNGLSASGGLFRPGGFGEWAPQCNSRLPTLLGCQHARLSYMDFIWQGLPNFVFLRPAICLYFNISHYLLGHQALAPNGTIGSYIPELDFC